MIRRCALVLAIVMACAAIAVEARAAEKDDATYARIVVDTAALRSGPGREFRTIESARRDDTFLVRGRAPLGHWLQVELSDGSLAYVEGSAVWLADLSDEGERSRVFAPPPLLRARGELAALFGVLGESGFLALRPNVMLAPTFGFEANLGVSVGSTGRLFVIGAGGLVNLFPSWPVTPFFAVGGGAARAAPNSDAFIFAAGTRSMLYGGGGLRFGFRHHLILRVEARNYALFEPDELVSRQEISGGLSAFF